MRKRGYSSPNQRSVNINKESCNSEKLYAKINIEAMNSAMRDLKPASYKLWCYFAENQNAYSFWLSPVDVHIKTGIVFCLRNMLVMMYTSRNQFNI